MSYLVINCFHWIGFHFVNELLENGYEVDGLEKKTSKNENQEHLSMFFGRNNSFSLLTEPLANSLNEYDASIIIGDYQTFNHVKSHHVLKISHETDETDNENNGSRIINIKPPLLFGEWMVMDEKGMFYGNEYILFESDYFLKNAVYITVFIQRLLQWLRSRKQLTDDEMNHVILENNFNVDDNKRVDYYIKKVLKHYESFKEYY